MDLQASFLCIKRMPSLSVNGIELLKCIEVRSHFLSRYSEDILRKELKHLFVQSSKDENQIVRKWLDWCKSNSSVLRCVEGSVPQSILSGAQLIDVKVGTAGRHRKPDDTIYNRSAEIRRQVARGNCVLRLPDGRLLCLTHALKKFTGGMGDEDDDLSGGDDSTWRRYFLRSPEAAERLVLTQKANGEAAHLSARYVDGSFLVCVGSKNVHMVLRQESDIARYADQRYRVAREVAAAVWRLLEAMGEGQRQLLLSFLHHTRLTAVMELLQPDHQHVVDLSHLKVAELRFITWTGTLGDDFESYCGVTPELGFELAEMLGMKTVEHSVVIGDVMNELPRVMQEVREGHGYEGKVLYFVDGNGKVVGVLKKKTVWYILLRALREKLSYGLKKQSFKELKEGIKKRFREIQAWLCFDDEFLQNWLTLSFKFAEWLKNGPDTDYGELRTTMPPLWTKFLRECRESDKYDISITT
ncbi:uncharacterized protein LOC122382292 isoform X3 [Amphibalanus amphitrite]|uniref:uncharacterized protein LOC122382292 isoform X3 n=1 Tax=Amphibalanus amphitrite TaxID=1232801 RepID=UPI001C8FE9FC|nr:uncharacterized protein LOC122382292 isoform X3 [Amphibalanus amphitrite]